MLHPLLQAFLDTVFPPRCHICHAFIPQAGELHICSPCHELLPPPAYPQCSVCGLPFEGAGPDHPCGACLLHPPHYDAARAALLYAGPCQKLIHAFKYHHKTHLRRPLALLTSDRLAETVTGRAMELIVPVPLHRRRLASRGFNQAVLLGELLARRWNLPLERRLLVRVRWTEPQITLAAAERRANVRGAFEVADPGRVAGMRVVLLDDVMTTGSTVDECARTLKEAGAAEVLVITVARAL